MRSFPRGTKTTWYFIGPLGFHILRFFIISKLTYHPLGVNETPKVIFWWTSIYFHHKYHSSSTFHGYDQYEDIGELVQQ